jgi:hypothetical protein
MVVIGFGLVWWGYLELMYGWALLKGWDVTWKQLANPLNPYQWPVPPAQPPIIPNTQILPGAATKTTTTVQTDTKTQPSTLPHTKVL